MDMQFNSKLQTAIQNLGRSGAFAPPQSQDPADAILHEYFVAETARSSFDKRKKLALDELKGLDTTKLIDRALKEAVNNNPGTTPLFETPNYSVSLTTKTPGETLDKVALKNALKLAGVDDAIITAAFKTATKANKPAETYTVMVKRS